VFDFNAADSLKGRVMKDHILVITENKNHELILKKKLSDGSLIFIPAHLFSEEKLSHLRFSFIIIDEIESEKKTLCMVDEIKRHPNTKASPILVITGKLNRSYLERLIRHGVANFLSLPLADENVYQTLKDTASGKKANEVISQMKIPIIEDADQDLGSHSIIAKEEIEKVKQAFIAKGKVVLALFSDSKRPESDDLVLDVSQNLYLIVSLTKSKKGLLDDILQIKSKSGYAGIVSTDDHEYSDIAPMIEDAKRALERAKEMPNGFSFYVKT